MLLRKSDRFDANIRSSDITPQEAFENYQQARRRFLTGAAALGAGVIAATHVDTSDLPLSGLPANNVILPRGIRSFQNQSMRFRTISAPVLNWPSGVSTSNLGCGLGGLTPYAVSALADF